MTMLSKEQKSFLWDASVKYHEAVDDSPAAAYLERRGLAQAAKFKLGYVAEPLPGHEMYRGMLAIPYLRRSPLGAWSVASIKFRCIEDHDHKAHGHPKYKFAAGDKSRLFNTVAFDQTDDTIGICEGEIDAISASIAGVPSVGIAGADNWQEHFAVPFVGYETVYIFADNDDAGQGMKFADKVAKQLGNARIIPCERGYDLNAELVDYGIGRIKEKIK